MSSHSSRLEYPKTCVAAKIPVTVENPHTSRLWNLPGYAGRIQQCLFRADNIAHAFHWYRTEFCKMARPVENARHLYQPTSCQKAVCAAAMVRACALARHALTNACKGSSRRRDVTLLSSPSRTPVLYAAASYTPTTPATSRERCGGCARGFRSNRSPHQQFLWLGGK